MNESPPHPIPPTGVPAASDAAERLRARGPEIVEAWMDRLRALRAAGEGSVDLEDAYRRFGAALIDRMALRLASEAPEVAADAEVGRALARVAGATRKQELATWQALADLNLLLPEILAVISDDPDGREDPRGGEAIACDMVGTAVVSLTRVLEATALRIQRVRSETLASMTEMLVHELHNRLGAAETASRMLLNPAGELDEEWLARISRLIRASLEDGLRTVEDVRSLAATRANLEEAVFRPIPLPILVREVLRELDPRAGAAGVRVTVTGELPDVRVDAARLRLILTNLVGNAVKYHDPEEVKPMVWISGTLDDDGHLRVRVRDNGIGIEEEELEEIFLHRFRGDQAKGIDGTGLGLAIVREAADQLGATIRVDSDVGVGTSFELILPRLESAAGSPSS